MKVTAQRSGTWPAGVHWTAGESRDLNLADDVDLPAWLSKAKAKGKGKAKAKADEPSAAAG
jgi:hypothetical protein